MSRNIYYSKVSVKEIDSLTKEIISEETGSNTKGASFHNIMSGILANINSRSIRFFKIGTDNTFVNSPSSLVNDVTGGNLDIDNKYMKGKQTAVFELKMNSEDNTYDGFTIGEAGLYTLGGDLVARYNFNTPKLKSPNTNIEIIWEITFI